MTNSRECPACGSILQEGQQYCPACGTKVALEKNTASNHTNAEFEKALAQAEAYATSVLYTKSKIVLKEVNQGELNFLSIIDKYPAETKSYVAYVNYMVNYINRILNPQKGDETIFLKDFHGMVEKLKSFLQLALKYADDDADGNILQEISNLQRKVDSLSLDTSNEEKHDKQKKKTTIISVLLFVLFVVGIICYICQ